MLPHLGAAYNLARWLTRDAHDADDVVQEAYLRAYQFFDSFHGGDGRAWLLRVVRNTCHTWREKNRSPEPPASFDEAKHSGGGPSPGPEEPLVLQQPGFSCRGCFPGINRRRHCFIPRLLHVLGYGRRSRSPQR